MPILKTAETLQQIPQQKPNVLDLYFSSLFLLWNSELNSKVVADKFIT